MMNKDTRTTLEFTPMTTTQRNAPPTYFAVLVHEDRDGNFHHEYVAEIQETEEGKRWLVRLQPKFMPNPNLQYTNLVYFNARNEENPLPVDKFYGKEKAYLPDKDTAERWVKFCLRALKEDRVATANQSSALLARASAGNAIKCLNMAWYPLEQDITVNLLLFSDGRYQVRLFRLTPFRNDYSFQDCLTTVDSLEKALEVFVFHRIPMDVAEQLHPASRMEQIREEIRKSKEYLQPLADAFLSVIRKDRIYVAIEETAA